MQTVCTNMLKHAALYANSCMFVFGGNTTEMVQTGIFLQMHNSIHIKSRSQSGWGLLRGPWHQGPHRNLNKSSTWTIQKDACEGARPLAFSWNSFGVML